MINWLSDSFPCCRTRDKQPKSFQDSSTSTSKQLCDISIMFPSVPQNDSKSEPILKPSISSSTTLCSKSNIESLRNAESFAYDFFNSNCKTCGNPPQGFCTACIDKKYCKACFDVFHNSLPKFHCFVPYKRREANKILNSKTTFSQVINRIERK